MHVYTSIIHTIMKNPWTFVLNCLLFISHLCKISERLRIFRMLQCSNYVVDTCVHLVHKLLYSSFSLPLPSLLPFLCDRLTGDIAQPRAWLPPHLQQMALTIKSDGGIHLAGLPDQGRPSSTTLTDLFVFSAQHMRHPALFALGIWGLAVGTRASLSWQEFAITLWSFSTRLNAQRERERPASCPRCHLGTWQSECILNRKDQWPVLWLALMFY